MPGATSSPVTFLAHDRPAVPRSPAHRWLSARKERPRSPVRPWPTRRSDTVSPSAQEQKKACVGRGTDIIKWKAQRAPPRSSSQQGPRRRPAAGDPARNQEAASPTLPGGAFARHLAASVLGPGAGDKRACVVEVALNTDRSTR
jgi:hypothetical protein